MRRVWGLLCLLAGGRRHLLVDEVDDRCGHLAVHRLVQDVVARVVELP
jgi:hypothetical protein